MYNDIRILYSYNDSGRLVEQQWLSWNEAYKEFRLSPQMCFHGACTGGCWIYEYDQYDRLITKLSYDSIDPNNNYVFRDKNVYEYDMSGNQTGLMFYGWNYESDSMIPISKEYWDYDSHGNQVEYINYYWDTGLNEWFGSWKEIRKYDSIGNLFEQINQYWNQELSVWFEGDSSRWIYDRIGNQIEYINYYWDQDINNWIRSWREIRAYDSLGNQTENMYYNWDRVLNKWTGTWRESWKYDSLANKIEYFSYNWYQDINQWIDNGWTRWNYDDLGNQIEHEEYYWDQGLNEWQGAWREVWKFDSDGNEIEFVQFEWDSDINSWREWSRGLREYDPSGNMIREFKYERDYDMNEMVLNSRSEIYWSSILTFPDQSFFIDENCSDSIYPGTLKTNLENPDELPTFTIVSRDDYDTFILDTLNGEIKVKECSKLDYELKTEYLFTVMINMADSLLVGDNLANVMIYTNNINDNAPVLSDTVFDIDENSEPGTFIGEIKAIDADGNLDPLSYSIIAGNDDSVFRIDSMDGTVSLQEGAILDYETRQSYNLTVEVSDGLFTDEAEVTILVNDIVEVFNNPFFSGSSIKIYPNPTDDILYIDVPEEFRNGFELEMTSLTGRMILQQSGYVDRLNLSDLQAGLYILRIRTGQSILVGRVLIY